MDITHLETLLDRLVGGVVVLMLISLALLAFVAIAWVVCGGSSEHLG